MLSTKLPTFSRLLKNTASSSSAATRGLLLRGLNSSCSFSTIASSEQAAIAGNGVGKKKSSWGRKFFQIGLISLTGGIFLSGVNDLAIFHGCSTKAIEKASQNEKIVNTLGLPIVRGPWYDASLAVGQRRHSVSCTFPVSGPNGTGIFQFKAIRSGEETTFSFLRHHDWDILIMEALLHIPSNDEKNQTIKINLADSSPSPATFLECKECRLPETAAPEK